MPNFKNLVFEGGGVKGIAYVGALRALEDQNQLKTVEHVAGASAGAATALLLSLGYTIKELTHLLNMDFSTFVDGYSLKLLRVAHAARTFGAHPGAELRKHMAMLIAAKLNNNPDATFSDLHDKVVYQGPCLQNAKYRDVHMIGTNLSTTRAEIFSYYTTPDMPLADAVRVSMSIPLFFEPKIYEKAADGDFKKTLNGTLIESDKGNMYVDGGLVDNYPVHLFDNGYPNPETLGFRVDPPEEIAVLRDKKEVPGQPILNYADYGMAILNAAMSAQARQHELDNFRTVFIDTGAISTVQFKLTDRQKQTLINAGYFATEQHLKMLSNPKAKDPGNRLLTNQQRHEKHDRYAIYQKVTSIFYKKDSHGQGKIQLLYIPSKLDDVWVLRRKVTKHYERLINQSGVINAQRSKRVNCEEQVQVLTLTVHQRLIDELDAWLVKHPLLDKKLSESIAEENLVALAESTNQGHPAWMVNKDKHSRLKAEMLKWVNLGAYNQVSQLLKQGAATNYKDERGNQPLHISASVGNPGLINLLLDNHADVLSQNTYGDTPLHIAAKYDIDGDCVAILINRGAAVNQQNKLGLTPLMLAAEQRHIAVVKLLIESGARVDLADKEGTTALDRAILSQNQTLIDYFENKLASIVVARC